MSQDYAPAEMHQIIKANYSSKRFRTGSDLIVVHVSGGSSLSAFNTFSDENREASYHYLVDYDGTPWQYVREECVAWHAGYWDWNSRSFGVGLAGSLTHNEDKTDKMYQSLAKLIAHLCETHKIPMDRKHIRAHAEVPGCPAGRSSGGGSSCHSDPGKDFRWRYLLSQARK